ncbi:hypothetical protein MYSTI_08063 [Myxococcus stipitatus DSM 14675]|uniref:Uncharacterized protein n=1 Tax=Myxococcus stipitatus (strain DSM 14675 / JCM 12634 / Mx s8) TaxID=1278073 RepID=L7URT3_MYXSD|nr:hypothetical protein [Myxococcus stipitatus]AGC49329.1 hypothetical protein MYSTI_08063 [Myxococcus stipitatus DSM 14675]
MKRLFALLLALAPAARAQDSGTVPLDFPSIARGGSETAAGLDIATAGEVVHPANPTALVASLRGVGAVLDGAQVSFALQFNPYLLTQGFERLYPEAVAARQASTVTRLLQDTAVTLAIGQDTPFQDFIPPKGRFATVMAGVSVDVLGERGIYGARYNTCIQQVLADLSLYEFPDPPLPGDFEDSASFQKAQAEHRVAMEAARQAGIARITQRLSGCTRESRESSSALFLSAGGRWVTPGLKSQEGDGVAIQRGFGAATLDLLSSADSHLELALQVRLLQERQRPELAMDKWMDVGLSFGVASRRFQLKLEANQSLLKLGGTESRRASLIAHTRVVIAERFTVGLGVQGQGQDMSDALGQLRPSLVLDLAELPSLLQPVSAPRG